MRMPQNYRYTGLAVVLGLLAWASGLAALVATRLPKLVHALRNVHMPQACFFNF